MFFKKLNSLTRYNNLQSFIHKMAAGEVHTFVTRGNYYDTDDIAINFASNSLGLGVRVRVRVVLGHCRPVSLPTPRRRPPGHPSHKATRSRPVARQGEPFTIRGVSVASRQTLLPPQISTCGLLGSSWDTAGR